MPSCCRRLRRRDPCKRRAPALAPGLQEGRLAAWWGEVRARRHLLPSQQLPGHHGPTLACAARAPPCPENPGRMHDAARVGIGKEEQMNCKRLDAKFFGLVATGLALACERGAPIAEPTMSRADALSASVAAPAHSAEIGWEIFGSASDTARDGLKITITGSGTFVAPAHGRGRSGAATGGGTWETRNASGTVTGSGDYRVTDVVLWERALASVPSIPGSTAGLAILRVEYDDGSAGTLTISCRI